jgi:hypothetical protein
VSKANRIRLTLAASLAAVALLALAQSAPAQVVVGQTAPNTALVETCNFPFPYDEFQVAVAGGPSYAIPTAGVLTSWSVNEGPGTGSLTLKVFRPIGPGLYQIVGHDGPRPLTPNTLNTFPVSIPVAAGDVVGLSVLAGEATNCAFETGLEGDVVGYAKGSAGDGATIAEENSFKESRLNISATLLPPPAITAISPTKGSVKGGTSVAVTGGNFASVTAVAFGSTPAKSFTVDSEGQITAIAPASKTLSKVPVTVTTIAGTATSSQTFVYQGCKVPQLKNKKLKAAKKKLKKGGCKLGKVKKLDGATTATGKVKKQSPKPGKILAPGSKVKVTLDD